MEQKSNIQELQPVFDEIRHRGDDGKEYWSSRELSDALGYSGYWKFKTVIDKAIAVANDKGMKIDEHFNQSVDMVRVGGGAFRKVEAFNLSRLACLIIVENADGKKPMVQQARLFFSNTVSTGELLRNSVDSNKTAQGVTRIEVIFNGDTFWMSQKRMAGLFGVDVRTVNYHLKQIFDNGELSEAATIRKIGIVQPEGDSAWSISCQ